jgi:hypothetical protein
MMNKTKRDKNRRLFLEVEKQNLRVSKRCSRLRPAPNVAALCEVESQPTPKN